MEIRNELLAVILAGGKGERLSPLTRDRAKPAVPFGGGYRIIDFTLSNCYNSGLRKILVLTQYKAMSLDRHLSLGWSRLFCRDVGQFLDVVPPQMRIGDDWYQGTANAVYQNIYSMEKERPKWVLILAGDHIYRMNYEAMLAFHLDREADLTIAAASVPTRLARNRLGVLEADRLGRVRSFEEKPSEPKEIPDFPGFTLASMGIYLFNAGFLFEELCRDATIGESRHDFGKNVIPRLVSAANLFAWRFGPEDETAEKPNLMAEETEKELVSGYWRDVGTLDNYYEATMDLVSVNPRLNLYDEEWPIWTWRPNDPPPKFVFNEADRRGEALESLVCPGTIVSGGSVRHSVLGRQVRIHRRAVIEDSIVFDRVRIGRDARIRRAIIDKDAEIPDGDVIGFNPDADRARGFFVGESGITVVPKSAGTKEINS